MQATGGAGLSQSGWYDFRNGDRKPIDNALDLAIKAFCYISFDDADSWRQNLGILQGVLSFLMKYRVASPTSDQLQELLPLLSNYPASHKTIVQWFAKVFPPLDK
jgi:hypothetical protein